MEQKKRKFGDRRDARWVKEAPALQTIMAHLFPYRTGCEVYAQENIDATELVKYLEKRNEGLTEGKTTLFHCFVTTLLRILYERPQMNYFVQGHRIYEKYDKTIAFVCKRRFNDHAEEALITIKAHDDDDLSKISSRILGDVTETRKSEHATGGIDKTLDSFAKLPRPILMLVCRVVRWLDFWGKVPVSLTVGDTNYASILCTNLGSIKTSSVYHHLNNYGTNSVVVAIGTLHKEEVLMPDGTKQIRDIVDIGVTLDERIADGFYFAKSLKLINYIFAHPELLDKPLSEPSGFDFK